MVSRYIPQACSWRALLTLPGAILSKSTASSSHIRLLHPSPLSLVTQAGSQTLLHHVSSVSVLGRGFGQVLLLVLTVGEIFSMAVLGCNAKQKGSASPLSASTYRHPQHCNHGFGARSGVASQPGATQARVYIVDHNTGP